MNRPQVQRLGDGRLHLNHGPIDLICQGWGEPDAVSLCYDRAVRRFEGLLAELVAELPALRSEHAPLDGPIARKMARAVAPFRPAFITPMAAVAGAVAEAVLGVMVAPGISRAYVNNGGDIAFHLEPGASLSCAIATATGMADRIIIRHADPVRGIATSGWRGRSWSLGIADSVTILARTASMADAAATIIANAVNLPGHPAITRRAACLCQADSDLGDRLVTVAVGPLSFADVRRALDRGEAAADRFRALGLIEACAIFLHPETRAVGAFALKEPAVA